MKLSIEQIQSILILQRDRWVNDDLRSIYSKEELIGKIEDDFLSENDITDKSHKFLPAVDIGEVGDMRRHMARQAINYHFGNDISCDNEYHDFDYFVEQWKQSTNSLLSILNEILSKKQKGDIKC